MNPTVRAQKTAYQQQMATWLNAHASLEPDALSTYRRSALATFEQLSFPLTKGEAWRYTPLNNLLAQPFTLASGTLADTHALPPVTHPRLVIIDGVFAPSLSNLSDLPPGLNITPLGEHTQRTSTDVLALDDYAHNIWAAMNAATFSDGLLIQVDAGVKIERPLEAYFVSTTQATPTLYQLKHVLELGQGAELTFLEHYSGVDEHAYWHNDVLQIDLADGAKLTHLKQQQEGTQATHFQLVDIQQWANSQYDYAGYALGGHFSRTDMRIRFSGRGARAEVAGLLLSGAKQTTDYHYRAQHDVPDCHSNSTFKAIVHGPGKAVIDGQITVAPAAQKTQAHFSNDNLLLNRQGEVDSKPQLEIYADDVKCSHGTTVGEIDPAQLFYLQSRGIELAEAYRLLCLGFAETLLSRCTLPDVHTALHQRINHLLVL